MLAKAHTRDKAEVTDQEARKHSLDMSDLNRKARSGEITIDSFFDELERRGITGLRQAICVWQAFGIDLGEAKLALIKRQPGGIDAWERQFDEIDLTALETEPD
ncbi:MAG: hypothetical protein IT174_04755 [Acidobacteria bacterium]|nr:hypothetical protein [Acidobacteriota bacterium]